MLVCDVFGFCMVDVGVVEFLFVFVEVVFVVDWVVYCYCFLFFVLDFVLIEYFVVLGLFVCWGIWCGIE